MSHICCDSVEIQTCVSQHALGACLRVAFTTWAQLFRLIIISCFSFGLTALAMGILCRISRAWRTYIKRHSRGWISELTHTHTSIWSTILDALLLLQPPTEWWTTKKCASARLIYLECVECTIYRRLRKHRMQREKNRVRIRAADNMGLFSSETITTSMAPRQTPHANTTEH